MYDAFTINDFSGGITDNSKMGIATDAEICRNLLLNTANGLDKRPGSWLYDSLVYRLPNSEATRTMFISQDNLFIASSKHLYRIDPTPTLTDLLGPTNNFAFNLGDAAINFYSVAEFQKQLFWVNDAFANPVKVYKDNTGTWKLNNVGLPVFDKISVTLTPTAGANRYLYGMCYYYTYKVGDVTYEDFGPVELFEVASAAAPTHGTPIQIAGLPTIANGTTDNYDTANIKIRISRTVNAGQDWFKVTDLSLGTTTYDDEMDDATLLLQTSLYINGGILDNDQPPPAKFVTCIDNIMFYGNVVENGENKGFRIRQSKPGNPNSCPIDLTIDVDDDITGMVRMASDLLVFTYSKTYRISGSFTASGAGNPTKRILSNNIGCVSHDSIKITDSGVFFAGNVGFCWSDGYRITKLSGKYNARYSKLIKTRARARSIYAAYDKINRQIWWACQLDDTNQYNDSCFVFNEFMGISENGSFTVMDNGVDYAPTSIIFNASNELIRGDRRGFIFKHTPTYRADIKINMSVPDPNDWSLRYIPWEYVSTELYAGSKEVRKYGSKLATRIKNISNISVQPWSANDGFHNWKPLAEIRHREQMPWGTRYKYWSQALNYLWENTQDINDIRYMPAQGSLRFYTKQIRYTPAFTIIDNSDTVGCTVSVKVGYNQPPFNMTPITVVELDDLAKIYYDYCDDHWIYFETDGYVKGYFIAQRISDTLIYITDPDGDFTVDVPNLKWVMRGYPKDELFSLISYSIYTNGTNENLGVLTTGKVGGNS